eukprot:PLAT12228.1.p1 GENE.PLAT12228.1~~PLAT12228.1.p1  ORF type:complete len:1010 (-),score=551.83 PLAT12228.1:62-2737(-)
MEYIEQLDAPDLLSAVPNKTLRLLLAAVRMLDPVLATPEPEMSFKGLAPLLLLACAPGLLIMALLLRHVLHPTLLSLPLPLSLFLYVLWCNPRPPPVLFRIAIRYLLVLLVVNAVLNLPVFCLCTTWLCGGNVHDVGAELYLSVHPFCPPSRVPLAQLAPLQTITFLGLDPRNFFAAGLGDFLVLVTLLLYRNSLVAKGLWDKRPSDLRDLLEKGLDTVEGEMREPRQGHHRSADSLYERLLAVHRDSYSSDGSSHKRSLSMEETEALVKQHRRMVTAVPVYEEEAEVEFDPAASRPLSDRLRELLVAALPDSWWNYWEGIVPEEGLKPGRDLYAFSFSVLEFILVYLIVAFSSMTSSSEDAGNSIVASLETDHFSGSMVLAVCTVVLVIVLDRVILHARSLPGKIALQVTTVLFVHLWVFFTLPFTIQQTFLSKPALVIFYLLCCAYWTLSGLQIRFGYPPVQPSLMERSTGPVSTQLFNVYRAVPFLFEMRCVLDWVCIKTSLDMYMWYKLEDLAAMLFTVKCEMQYRVRMKPYLSGRQPQPVLNKCSMGVTTFLILIVVLFGPLVLFSSANPKQDDNPVHGVSVSTYLSTPGATFPLWQSDSYQSLTTYSPPQFDALQSKLSAKGVFLDDQLRTGGVQRIEMMPYSLEQWDVSAPSLASLRDLLADGNRTVTLHVDITFTRSAPANALYPMVKHTRPLSPTQRQQLTNMVNGSSSTPMEVLNAFPAAYQLPPTGAVSELHANSGPMPGFQLLLSHNTTVLNPATNNNWWTVRPLNATRASQGLSFIIASDKVISGFQGSDYSVTTIYFTVVLAIGRFFRTLFSSPTSRIIMDEMPYPDPLMELVEGVYIARMEQYEGHFKDEVKLYEFLVRLFRSPEILLRITKDKLD